MKRLFVSAARALAAVVLCAPALAQAQQQPPAADGGGRGRMAVCRTDAARLCANAEAGRGRRLACLLENKAKLTPECAQAVDARVAERASKGGRDDGAARAPDAAPGPAANSGEAPRRGARGGRMAACRTDVATFCSSAEKGPGRTRCLRENQAKLSPGCQAVLGERVQQAQALREACKSDRESLCSSVQRGGGRMMQCLRDNREKLSAACGAALSAMPGHGQGRGKRAAAESSTLQR